MALPEPLGRAGPGLGPLPWKLPLWVLWLGLVIHTTCPGRWVWGGARGAYVSTPLQAIWVRDPRCQESGLSYFGWKGF